MIKAADEAVADLDPHVKLTSEQLLKPTVLSTDPKLTSAADSANTMIKADLELLMAGTVAGTVDASLISQWVSLDDELAVTLDEGALTAWVDELAAACNTVGTQRTYTRSDGKVVTVAGGLGCIIPPSIPFVLYSTSAGTSVGDMFMGGWIPGIMMGLSLVIIIMIECRKKGIQASKAKSSWGQRWKSFREAFWGFLMPVIIIGGIYGGVFTPTEAAAVSVVYGLVVGVFIYREVKMKDMIDILVDSGKTTGGIMLIIGAATLFSYVCTVFGIAQAAQALLLEISGNKYIFLLIVNVIFLIAGCFVDANSAMYIFIPIMYPVATQLGIDPVHFGVLCCFNLTIGLISPPVGMTLFVTANVAKVKLTALFKEVIPFVVLGYATLFLITYVPQIVTFIPNLLK